MTEKKNLQGSFFLWEKTGDALKTRGSKASNTLVLLSKPA